MLSLEVPFGTEKSTDLPLCASAFVKLKKAVPNPTHSTVGTLSQDI